MKRKAFRSLTLEKSPLKNSSSNFSQLFLKNNNSNLFSGESEYKMNFWLQFINPSTYKRFISDKSVRYRFFYRIYSYVILILPLLFQIILGRNIVKNLITVSLSILGGLITKYCNHRMILRAFHSIYAFILMNIFLKELNISSFFGSQICELFCGNFLVYSWIQYVLVSSVNIILHSINTNFQFQSTLLFIIISVSLSIIYGCIERAIKEDWVLFDSFKKSEYSYKSLFQEIFAPILIINEQTDLLYSNKAGNELLKNFSRGKKLKNLVSSENLIDFELKLSECIKKGEDTRMKIAIEKCIDVNGNITITLTHYKIKLRSISWKGRSNRILVILKNIDKKIEKDILLKNELVQIDNNLEYTQNYLEKMAKISGTKECKKLIFSLKSLNSRLTAVLMSKSKRQSCSFRISDYLFRFFDIFYNATLEEKIYLKITKDAYFPDEVTGDFRKFDVAFSMLLSFIINHGNIKSLELNLRMIDTTIEDYVLLFKLVCNSTQEFEPEELKKINDYSNLEMTKLRINTDLELTQSQIDIIMSKKIVQASLDGSFDIKVSPENVICFDLKINFSRNIDHQNCKTFTLFSPKHLPPNSSSTFIWDPKDPKNDEANEIPSLPQEEKSDASNFKKKALRKSTSVFNINKAQSNLNIKRIIQEEIKKKEEATRNEGIIQDNIYSKANKIPLTPQADFKNNRKKLFAKPSLSIINEEIHSGRSKEVPIYQILDEILERRPIIKAAPSLVQLYSEGKIPEKNPHSNNKTHRKNETKSIDEKIDHILNPDSYILDEIENNLASPSSGKQLYINPLYGSVSASKNIEFLRIQTNSPSGNNKEYNSSKLNIKLLNCIPEESKSNLLNAKPFFNIIQNQVSFQFQNQIKSINIKAFLKKVKLPIQIVRNKSEDTRVLIVEDNDFQLNAQIMILKALKVEYLVAKNGQCAVQTYEQKALENEFFTLILMDLIMPILDGFSATQRIREIESEKHYKKTFICGLSSDSSKGVEEKCMKSGMDKYKKKPVGSVGINELISQVLSKSKSK